MRYDLGSLKNGADLTIGPDGGLATTVDGDVQLGTNQHNALHRLVVRWQMEAPTLFSMFQDVLGSEEKRQVYLGMIDALVSRKSLDKETATDFRELQHAIGIHQAGPGTSAGGVAIALNNLLRREWVDLGRPGRWASAGNRISGRSLGEIIEAAANNFRHGDEWARDKIPSPDQLKSVRVLGDILGATLPPNGVNHPFRGNVVPKVLLRISGGNFEQLMDAFFGFARSLAGL